MASYFNISGENRDNSQKPISKRNIKIKEFPKTPEMLYDDDNEQKNNRQNTLNQERRKISINIEPNYYFHPLTLSMEENNNNTYDILHKKHLITISKYEQNISELSIINKKLDENIQKTTQLKENLKKLKEEKKQKQNDIVNLLSKKESLEEIYKNKIYYLNENKELKTSNNLIENNAKSLKYTDNENYQIEKEAELEIKIEEIKKSDKKKFFEQIISFTEDIFQKNEEEFINKIKEKINLAYKVFYTEINSSSSFSLESIIPNFFSRIGVYISNYSLGNYSESNINKFLRYLLKINSISIEIFQVIKFLNKKYKEKKIEIKEQINNLNKKNENLNEKRKNLEKVINDLEIKIEKNKENIQNLEQNKDKLEIENNNKLNNTLDNLLTKSNLSHHRKHKIMNIKEK